MIVVLLHIFYSQNSFAKLSLSIFLRFCREDFIHFAETCFEKFGDRVKYWITINEPNLYIANAYKEGTFPPSRCSEPYGNCSTGDSNKEPLVSMHNMLLAHAKAAKLYREHFQVWLNTRTNIPNRKGRSY